jgi:hypothetical protein
MESKANYLVIISGLFTFRPEKMNPPTASLVPPASPLEKPVASQALRNRERVVFNPPTS